MESIANRLNNKLVSCVEIDAAAGRFDEKYNCVRFPDGSAGRLITFRPRGVVKPLKETYVKFIELKAAGAIGPSARGGLSSYTIRIRHNRFINHFEGILTGRPLVGFDPVVVRTAKGIAR